MQIFRRLPAVVFLVTASIFHLQSITGFPSYQNRIPNGDKVVNPCNPSTIWKSVGHQNVTDDGRLNKFGVDFLAKGKNWQTVCPLDSDGDGRTNGEELGDPDCVWTANQTELLPITAVAITHPGVCEPIGSAKCAVNNAFLAQIPECVTALAAITRATTQVPPSWCPLLANEDYETMTISFNNVTLPARETAYICQQFEVPKETDYHIIAWEPLITNADITRQLILFGCDDAPSYAQLREIGGYLVPKECGLMPACKTMILSWGSGEGNRCYDPSVGVAIGKTKFRTVVLQILYNNPSPDSVDSSGILFYYTARLRPNENAMILVGQEAFAIPPMTSMTSVIGRSFATTSCSKTRLGLHSSYNLTRVLFHMQKMGVHGRLSIIKSSQNDTKIDVVNEDISYVGNGTLSIFKYLVSGDVVLEPGDNIEIECIYNSTSRSTWTFYGPYPSSDEMCFAYIDLYPKPADRRFQILDSVGRIDQCMFDNPRQMIGNCSMIDFHNVLGRIMQGTGGGLLEHCACSVYPATNCTASCYTFLTEWDLLSHPCVTEEDGMPFLVATRFYALPVPSDSFNVLSQINKCLQLTAVPASDVKCAGNNSYVQISPTTTVSTLNKTSTTIGVTNRTTTTVSTVQQWLSNKRNGASQLTFIPQLLLVTAAFIS